MQSYRAVLTIGRVHPGADPQAVLPAAGDAAAALTTLEAKSVGVARGRPQVTVRFTADDTQDARRIAAAVAAAASRLVEVQDLQIRRRSGTTWPLIPNA